MKAFLGIDVSKGYSDFVLLSEDGTKLVKTFQLDDTRLGHEKLKSWLTQVIEQFGLTQVDCAVESTGGFEDNWYASLVDWGTALPIRVARLNPSVVKNAARTEMLVNVTDSESARSIASYIRRYSDHVDYRVNANSYAAFRSLHGHLVLLTKQKTQLINELKHLLYIAFPELQRYCKQSIPNWVLTLLIQCPSSPKLAKAKIQKIIGIKSISSEKAKSLIDNAKTSVAARKSSLTDEFLIQTMAREIMMKQKNIDELKKHLAENCRGKETQLLESIPGIAAYSAASIMIQIEDINRFPSPKELASYFGLHPTIKESGDKSRVSRMSKQGRPAIRATLFMCANAAVLFDPHLKEIYARHRSRGKGHRQALGVIMHKLLRIIWGVLKSSESYQSEIDRYNQTKSAKPSKESREKQVQSKRRLQEFDEAAPISRSTSKKRKVHTASQVGEANQVRDLEHEPPSVNI